jgi:hypothetical protein
MYTLVNRKAIILFSDGTWQWLPEPVIDREEITWPLGLPKIEPGKPVKMLSQDDFYRRHELIKGIFFVYVKDSSLIPNG